MWDEEYRANGKADPGELRRRFNSTRREEFPWMGEELGPGQARTRTPVERKALAAVSAAKPRLAEAGTYSASCN